MKIAVLLKWVPDLVEELEVDDSGTGLDTEDLKFKLNEFDDHALEAALIAAQPDDEVIAMALAGEGAEKMLFTALAKGATKAVQIEGASSASSRSMAVAFGEAVKSEVCDLVLTGVQSVDDLDGQLAPLMAALSSLPCISVVSGLSVEGGTAIVSKEYSGGIVAEFAVDLPAVFGVQAAAEAPRYAPVSKIRQIQQTASIEQFTSTQSNDSGSVKVVGFSEPESGGRAEMLGDAEELAEVLKELGVV